MLLEFASSIYQNPVISLVSIGTIYICSKINIQNTISKFASSIYNMMKVKKFKTYDEDEDNDYEDENTHSSPQTTTHIHYHKMKVKPFTFKQKMITAFVAARFIFYAIYYSLKQKLINNVIRIDKNTSIVKYAINGIYYEFLVEHTYKGPCPILMILDENGNDVSSLILPLLGPEYDCYGKTITPSFFNKNNLEFYMINSDILSFGKDDNIALLL